MAQASSRSSQSRRRLPAAATVVIGFVPWIVYWVLLGTGWTAAALFGGFAVAAGINLWRWRQGGLKILELAGLAFFAVVSAGSLAGLTLPRGVERILAELTLAATAWGSLACGRPFTEQYAREDWPPAFWSDPGFKAINRAITAVWGVVFLVNAGLASVVAVWPAGRPLLDPGLTVTLMVLAIVFSARFPIWSARRAVGRRLEQANPYRWPMPEPSAVRPAAPDQHDAIVVGSGIGGLTAAALLARRGLKVLVLEQHFLAGGFCTSWERGVRRGDERLRYVFDAGVHDVSGLGPRGPIRLLLRELGIEARLDWRRMSHRYLLDGLDLTLPERLNDLIAELTRRFPSERDGIRAVFDTLVGVYHDLYAGAHGTGGVPRPPTTVDEALRYPREHPLAFRWMNEPFGPFLYQHIASPDLRAVLSSLTGYLSDDERTLTVGMMAPIFGYYVDGGYYPAGGSGRLADALVDVVKAHGGEVRLRTAVRRIVVEGGRATGVELGDGRVERSPVVIANGDVGRTFRELVGSEHLPADLMSRLDGTPPATSAFVVFLGVDMVPQTAPITMTSGSGGGVGITVPSLVDPSLAPPGHAAITLTTLAPHEQALTWDRQAPDYRARRRALGDELIARAERAIPGLSKHIVYRQEGSPATFARYAWTTDGSIYGLAGGGWRPSARTPIPGLLLAGSGVFPGAGVEAVAISGILAADAICPKVVRTPVAEQAA